MQCAKLIFSSLSVLEKVEKAKSDMNLKILEVAASLEEERKVKQQLKDQLDEATKSLESEKSKSNKDVSKST